VRCQIGFRVVEFGAVLFRLEIQIHCLAAFGNGKRKRGLAHLPGTE